MRSPLAIVALLLALVRSAEAQDSTARANDPLFPRSGGVLVTAVTGIPYVGIGEVAYGLGDRFAIGVVAGMTPVIPGYGIRARMIVSESDEWRLHARLPILYYPKTVELGGEPWMLAWPVVASEWRLRSGVRFSVQGGIVAAACVESLLGLEEEEEIAGSGEIPHDDHSGMGSAMDMEFDGDIWNTLGAGISVPLSPTTTFITEAHIVLHGLSPAKKENWIGGPPAIVVIGVTREF
jgi:hypothetical protein